MSIPTIPVSYAVQVRLRDSWRRDSTATLHDPSIGRLVSLAAQHYRLGWPQRTDHFAPPDQHDPAPGNGYSRIRFNEVMTRLARWFPIQSTPLALLTSNPQRFQFHLWWRVVVGPIVEDLIADYFLCDQIARISLREATDAEAATLTAAGRSLFRRDDHFAPAATFAA
jgi:hypothetical protein